MKFTDFFWDFDGTLFDTYPRINRAIQNALKDCNITVSLETIEPLSKVNVRHAIDTLAGDKAKAVAARYEAHEPEEGFDSMRPYPGVLRLMRSICEHGGRNYLYTHRGKSSLEALEHYGMTPCFADAVTSENGFPSKPAPDALLYLMEKHRLDPAKCVMLGDRDIDLGSGKNAGMACALFDPGHYYDAYDTPLRYTDMFDLMADLVWEGRAEDLRVSDMLTLQQKLQSMHPEWGGNHPDKAVRQTLWLVGELGEVIDILKKVDAEHLTAPGENRQRLVEELADVSMYFHDLLDCYGITAEEFSQAYYGKMERNFHRNYLKEHKDRYGV